MLSVKGSMSVGSSYETTAAPTDGLIVKGNVGIGTTSSAQKLQVYNSGYGIEQTDGTRRLSTYVSASGGWFGTISNDPLKF